MVTEDLSFKQDELPADRSLVIIDDDRSFLQRLARAMELRGFEVRFGHSVAEGVDLKRLYRAYSVGAIDYLQKPVDADVVRAKVAVFADLYRKELLLRLEGAI